MATSKRITQEDIAYMQLAIAEARKGAGFVQTNPLVGAVLVHNNTILIKGYHARYGGKHAERLVLEKALRKYSKKIIQESTLYITLEPCSQHGKTPACLPLVQNSKVARVCIGSFDPNPVEQGRSSKALRKAGMNVTTGVAQVECDYVIRAFAKWITTQRPFVLAKVGMSLDAKVTHPKNGRYITNQSALQRVHELRQEFDAIMVGVNTIIRDNPRLNTRLPQKRIHHPTKIILDSRLRTPVNSAALDNNTIIVCLENADLQRRKALARKGVDIMEIPPIKRTEKQLFEHMNIKVLLEELGKRRITSIVLEGGPYVFTSFINRQAIDEWYMFIAPSLYGATRLPFIYALQYSVQLRGMSVEQCPSTPQELTAGKENNILVRGYAEYN